MSETEEINPIAHWFKHPDTLEFDKLVAEYVAENGTSPFVNIDLKDEKTGEVMIDMEAEFNTDMEARFGHDLNDIISDYIMALLNSMKESDEFEDPEVSQNGN